MSTTTPGGDATPAPTEPPAGSGEGAQTALLALIRKRKQQADYEDETLPLLKPRQPPGGQ
ncbi:hypothetical protein [Ramlibacter albus]|uniref:Uncharacterized protein n=1 Tax=Ramlibacter albus TaxID=2079448 RepID=A0A923M8T6_9BURK|nr:hypothetical protein [Ramlibacter albus]MBC5766125.1 hypothetical protein [Ramlibacter albus]